MEKIVYLNNAATSWPKPDCVAEAVQKALQSPPGSMHRGGIEDVDVFALVRQRLATLLGVKDAECIALGSNATWGLNLALHGFPLQAGDVVVTTRAEHNSVLRPLYQRAVKEGIRVVYLDTDEVGRVPLSFWERAMADYRPRLAVFTHASNVTGAVHDAAEMTALAKSVGAAVLLDASQSLGWIPMEADSWGIDMIAFTGHKYLLGPQGTGGLFVRKGISLQPWLQGGTGIRSELEEMPGEMPLRLEAGTGNEPSFHGLLVALEWAGEHPLEEERHRELLGYLREGLMEAGARVILPDGPTTPVVSFTLPGESVADVGYILGESYDIICRTGLHCAPKLFSCLGVSETVRISLSRFTQKEDVDAVLEAVRDIRG